MRRRGLLTLTGTALATAAAGCLASSDDAGSSGSSETPSSTAATEGTTRAPADATASPVTAPVDALWRAYNEKNYDALVDTYHPDSPNVPDESAVSFQGTVTVERSAVISRSDGSATVEADVSISGDGDRSETQLYDVRLYRGQWKIWSWARKDEGSSSPIPQAGFESEFDGAATGDDATGVLRITHTAGDTIDAGKLFVRGSGIVDVSGASPSVTTADVSWAAATGASEITAGTSITVGVSADYTVSLVYESEGSSATVARFEGTAR